MSAYPDRMQTDPEICHGKPTVRGRLYPAERILELLSAGMSHGEILGDDPDFEREDIPGLLDYATRLSRVKGIAPLA